MKRLSVIRLANYRSSSERDQQGLLPSELEVLLPSARPENSAEKGSTRKKKNTSAGPANRS